MIEATVTGIMSADSNLAGYVSTYNSSPAIFSEIAPEAAVKPFSVINVSAVSAEHLSIMIFNVYVNFFDYNKSRAFLRTAVDRVISIFDDKIFVVDPRFSYLRFWHESSGAVVTSSDSRDIHYNVQFMVRACRKAWIEQI